MELSTAACATWPLKFTTFFEPFKVNSVKESLTCKQNIYGNWSTQYISDVVISLSFQVSVASIVCFLCILRYQEKISEEYLNLYQKELQRWVSFMQGTDAAVL